MTNFEFVEAKKYLHEIDKIEDVLDGILYYLADDKSKLPLKVNTLSEILTRDGEITEDGAALRRWLLIMNNVLDDVFFFSQKSSGIIGAKDDFEGISLYLSSVIQNNLSKIVYDNKSKNEIYPHLFQISKSLGEFRGNYSFIVDRFSKKYKVDSHSILSIYYPFRNGLGVSNSSMIHQLKEWNFIFSSFGRVFGENKEANILKVESGSWELIFMTAQSIILGLVWLDNQLLERKKKRLELKKMYFELLKLKNENLVVASNAIKKQLEIDVEKESDGLVEAFKSFFDNTEVNKENTSFLRKSFQKLITFFIIEDGDAELLSEETNPKLLKLIEEKKNGQLELKKLEDEVKSISGEEEYAQLIGESLK